MGDERLSEMAVTMLFMGVVFGKHSSAGCEFEKEHVDAGAQHRKSGRKIAPKSGHKGQTKDSGCHTQKSNGRVLRK